MTRLVQAAAMKGQAMTRAIRISLLQATAVLVSTFLVVPFTPAGSATAPTAHYIYREQPVALDLDVSPLAVGFHDSVPAAVQGAIISGAGVPTLSSRPMGIDGWSLMDLRNPLA